MDITILLQAILQLIAGIGIFLVACQMMSSNLETASSARLKSLFSRMSNSRMLGVGIGTVATAAIQSSGATTVMVIGFVNVGIMSLAQAATIIYGANIGTTVTAQIVALGLSGGGGISTTVIFAAFAGLGAFMELFSKKDTWKTWGGIITGFGMLFVGLSLMSGSMKELSGLQQIKDFLASIEHPLMLVLFGAILTAIVQSSSVVTSIALTMAVTGLISLNQGIYLTMGSNIGSCVVAIIAGLTSGLNAKRTALIHLLFNCFGVCIFLIAAWVMHLVTSGALNYGVIFETMFPGTGNEIVSLRLAMFHTIFNCITVCIILPLTDYLVNLVVKILPENNRVDEALQEGQPHFHFVDEQMLRTPAIAVNQVKLEIENMAAIAIHNFNLAMDIISTVNFDKMEEFNENEKQLNYLNRNLIPYIVQLNTLPISEEDNRYLATAIRSIGDLERVGDYAVNLTEYAELLQNFKETFSKDLLFEVEQLRETMGALYQATMKTYMDHDFDALIEVNRYEDQVDEMVARIEKVHLQRLMDGIYPASVGQVYQEFASDTERIADHFLNVAKSIRQLHVGED